MGVAISLLHAMNIRFTSSLTPEDENLIAPALLKAFAAILELLPIDYSIRIETCDACIYQHTGTASAAIDPIRFHEPYGSRNLV